MRIVGTGRTGMIVGVAAAFLIACIDHSEAGVDDAPAVRPDPLAQWRTAKVTRLSDANRHSIHSYFNTSPESPDGRSVLFYASTTPDAQRGEIRIRDRMSGKETVLASGISVEDAHRVACQQWVSQGRRVAFHNVLNDEEWQIVSVDVASGRSQIHARGRQLGFGQPNLDVLPLYGPHWNPGPHRGLELLNVETGEITPTPLTAELVEKTYPEWIDRQFGGKPVSVFFPLLSPDGNRVLFKLATPSGGNFRSKAASLREGLIAFDLKRTEFLTRQDRWGHPAWHANSRDVFNTAGRLTDLDKGETRKLPGRWHFPGSHPSLSPDGTMFTTDTLADAEPWNGGKGSWAVVVGDVDTGQSVTLHQFDNSKGARSWRVSHPHPVFSPDGKRIYFNVSDGQWTQLFVAERQ